MSCVASRPLVDLRRQGTTIGALWWSAWLLGKFHQRPCSSAASITNNQQFYPGKVGSPHSVLGAPSNHQFPELQRLTVRMPRMRIAPIMWLRPSPLRVSSRFPGNYRAHQRYKHKRWFVIRALIQLRQPPQRWSQSPRQRRQRQPSACCP